MMNLLNIWFHWRRGGLATIGFALLLAATPWLPARANIAADFTGGSGYIRGTFANLGWQFDLTNGDVVGALGVFDYLGDGLTDSHQVGLWDSGGNLLASVTITNSDPLTASGSALGGWRFAAITPVTLAPGTYIVGAFYPTAADPFLGGVSNLTTASDIVYDVGTFTHGVITTFSVPDQDLGAPFNPGIFGPNLELIPEPSGYLMLAMGFGILWSVRSALFRNAAAAILTRVSIAKIA
jgi:hypothetical protein